MKDAIANPLLLQRCVTTRRLASNRRPCQSSSSCSTTTCTYLCLFTMKNRWGTAMKKKIKQPEENEISVPWNHRCALVCDEGLFHKRCKDSFLCLGSSSVIPCDVGLVRLWLSWQICCWDHLYSHAWRSCDIVLRDGQACADHMLRCPGAAPCTRHLCNLPSGQGSRIGHVAFFQAQLKTARACFVQFILYANEGSQGSVYTYCNVCYVQMKEVRAQCIAELAEALRRSASHVALHPGIEALPSAAPAAPAGAPTSPMIEVEHPSGGSTDSAEQARQKGAGMRDGMVVKSCLAACMQFPAAKDLHGLAAKEFLDSSFFACDILMVFGIHASPPDCDALLEEWQHAAKCVMTLPSSRQAFSTWLAWLGCRMIQPKMEAAVRMLQPGESAFIRCVGREGLESAVLRKSVT
eukprot:1161110-Pelagomonas_calceolata.AAC.9